MNELCDSIFYCQFILDAYIHEHHKKSRLRSFKENTYNRTTNKLTKHYVPGKCCAWFSINSKVTEIKILSFCHLVFILPPFHRQYRYITFWWIFFDVCYCNIKESYVCYTPPWFTLRLISRKLPSKISFKMIIMICIHRYKIKGRNFYLYRLEPLCVKW